MRFGLKKIAITNKKGYNGNSVISFSVDTKNMEESEILQWNGKIIWRIAKWIRMEKSRINY